MLLSATTTVITQLSFILMFNFLFSAEERILSEVEILLGGDKKQDKQEHSRKSRNIFIEFFKKFFPIIKMDTC